jgi:hypothetical protein
MRYFLLVLVMIQSVCFGQLIDELPKDDKGNLFYTEVVTVDSISSKELYLRARQFFVDNFKSANDVIQVDDKEAGVLIGKGLSQYYIKIAGVNNGPHQLWYTIKIMVKDGRYKYEIYDFFHSGVDKIERDRVERQFTKEAYYKRNGQPKDVYQKMKAGMTNEISNLIKSIKYAMDKARAENDW